MNWQKDGLEFRAKINGARCIVRTAKSRTGLLEWETVIHRDTEPVDESRHPTLWIAMGHAEGNA